MPHKLLSFSYPFSLLDSIRRKKFIDPIKPFIYLISNYSLHFHNSLTNSLLKNLEKNLFLTPVTRPMRKLIISILILFSICHVNGQIRILFDATKAESAGNADWVIDADLHNLDWNPGAIVGGGNESNAQRIPTPAQSGITATTLESYWDGALSYWAVDCVKKGYTVETLPYNGTITYGNTSNAQDLSNYRVFIVCEPNIRFTTAEKTAILNFVNHGGGLFMVSDHTVSDRNGDGWDSPAIWNDLLQSNSTGNTNPFGILFDLDNFSGTYSNIANLPTDSILHGPMGSVAKVLWSSGTSMTISPTSNSNVKGLVYDVSPASGNTGVLFASSRYGFGRVAAIGDSSPCDDGSGDTNDALFNGYMGDVPPNHRYLLMNATIWLATSDIVWTGLVSNDWTVGGNWLGGVAPTITDRAIIPACPPLSTYTPFAPIVLAGKVGNCKDLTVYTGATVTVQPTGTLNISH
jgi:hypothetical protein